MWSTTVAIAADLIGKQWIGGLNAYYHGLRAIYRVTDTPPEKRLRATTAAISPVDAALSLRVELAPGLQCA
jgi:hypothetical protein